MDEVASSPLLQAAVDGFDGLMVVTIRNVLSGAITISYIAIFFFITWGRGLYTH